LSDTFLTRERAKTVKAWFDYKGVRFLIASFHNEALQKALRELPADADEDTRYKVWCKHLFLAFEGLQNDDGSDMADTMEARIILMRDYTELANLLIAFSQNSDNFLGEDAVVDELGN